MENDELFDPVEGARTSNYLGWFMINPQVLFGFVGAICCYAWLFLMLGTSAFLPFVHQNDFVAGSGHFVFVVGVCVGLATTWCLSGYLAVRKKIHFAFACLFSCIGIAAYWVNAFVPLDWLILLAALFSGVGFALLNALYGDYICHYAQGSMRTCIDAIFLFSAVLCVGFLLTFGLASLIFATIFPLASLGVYAGLIFVIKFKSRFEIDRKASDERGAVKCRSYLATITSGIAVGYAVGCILCTQYSLEWPYILTECMLLIACIVLFYDSTHKKIFNESFSMRYFLLGASVIVFPLLFVSQQYLVVFAVLLLCASLFPTTCSLAAICKHIVICNLSAIRAFSLGRLMGFIGIALGMLLAFLGFSDYFVGQYGVVMRSVSVIVFIMLIIVSASFVMTEDNYPLKSRFKLLEEEQERGAKNSPPGIPIRKLDADHNDNHLKKPNVFQRKCKAIAAQYGLSSRQSEVLIMLAKGRNADYITKKLVISSHTAKAHIYNIYQKTGVHSRQELMDLVEAVRLDIPE